MVDKNRKKGLGRGLSALLAETNTAFISPLFLEHNLKKLLNLPGFSNLLYRI